SVSRLSLCLSRRPSRCTRFPYTTLFRSHLCGRGDRERHHDGGGCDADPCREVLAASELPLLAGLAEAPIGRLLGPFAGVGVAHRVTPTSVRAASCASAATTLGSAM